MIDTGALTDGVLQTLAEASGQLLGDGYKPEKAGWLDGQPNVGVFAPYGVLFFQGGAPRDATLRFEELVRGWSVNFDLSYFGGSRKQCDWVATQFRDKYGVLMRKKFGDYTVMGASLRTIGVMERRDDIDPPLWYVTDRIVLYCDA